MRRLVKRLAVGLSTLALVSFAGASRAALRTQLVDVRTVEDSQLPPRAPHACVHVARRRAGLALVLSPVSATVQAGASAGLDAMIVNYDDLPVVLVQPGDGSDVGWRTPILDWDVEIDGADRPRLQRPIVGRCGNINGLRPNEIIRLGGHQEMKLNDWCRLVAPLRPGRYRVRLSYRNDPELQWHDPGAHDVVAMAMVRSSTACDLVSNDVVLTVVK